MNKIVHLSLTKKDVPIRIDVVQYATTPSIVFVIDDYTPGSGATANLYIKKPDGTEIYNSCTISGNQVTYDPTTQSFASLGTSKCQLQIIESGDTAVSFLIYADVTENIIDSSAIESQDEFTALEEALREVGEFVKHDDTSGAVRLNGNLTIQKETPSVYLQNSGQNNALSKIEAQPINSLGNNLLMQAGGNLIIGGGEYPDNRYNATLTQDTGESAYIGADTDVFIESGGQTIANAKTFTFKNNGDFELPNAKIENSGKINSNSRFAKLGNTEISIGATTATLSFWSDANNLVLTRASNSTDEKQYGFAARSDRVRCWNYTDNQLVWDIFPPTVIAYGGNMGQDTVSVPNNAWTEVGTWTFAPGLYIVHVSVAFTANQTGTRQMNFQTAPATSGGGWVNNVIVQATSEGATTAHLTTLLRTSETKVFYLNALQTSGGSLNVLPRWWCVKIG